MYTKDFYIYARYYYVYAKGCYTYTLRIVITRPTLLPTITTFISTPKPAIPSFMSLAVAGIVFPGFSCIVLLP